MKKLKLFVVRPSDTKNDIAKKISYYLKQHGIKVSKRSKSEDK